MSCATIVHECMSLHTTVSTWWVWRFREVSGSVWELFGGSDHIDMFWSQESSVSSVSRGSIPPIPTSIFETTPHQPRASGNTVGVGGSAW